MDDRMLGRIEFDREKGVTLNDAAAVRDGMEQRTQSALALYRAMRATGQLSKARIIEYRCEQHGCLLLDVYDTPAGPASYMPAHRYSPQRNARTSREARTDRTTDGQRRWVENADLFDTDPPANLGVEYWVNCDHLLDHALPAEKINADIAATRRGARVFVVN